MTTSDKFLKYRGNICGVTSFGKTICFATHHQGLNAGFLYRMDGEDFSLDEISLPAGGKSLLSLGDSILVGGTGGELFLVSNKAKSAKTLKTQFETAVTQFAKLANDQFAAVNETHLVIASITGKIGQEFPLKSPGTCIAVDPEGEWIAVGQKDGTISVFESEDKDEFQPAESEKIHQAAVTSILFEPDELRFFSAGADQKLYLTHARGRLEPEDRGRSNNHDKPVVTMVNVHGDRLITGSKDKTCKSWQRNSAVKPSTLSGEVTSVVDLCLAEIHKRPNLVVACEDDSIRFVLIDEAGKFASTLCRVYDATARARHQLGNSDPKIRGEAIHDLADYDDQESVEMLAAQVKKDSDRPLRAKAAELLTKSQHPRSTQLLDGLVKHDDPKVRITAFEGIVDRFESDPIRSIKRGLEVKFANVGCAAVKLLEKLAKDDDVARNLLVKAMGSDPIEVRQSALLALEKIEPQNSPSASLLGMTNPNADLRKLALIRLVQRKLLDDQATAAARRAFEDKDPDVRRTALLTMIASRKKLVDTLTKIDDQLAQQLDDIKNFEAQVLKESDSKKSDDKKGDAKPKAKTRLAKNRKKPKLSEADLIPLLAGIASRANDTALAAAGYLAALGDTRVFGLLLQLSRDEDAHCRVQVCQALADLDDMRALQRLETLANDPGSDVRDAAYSALIHLAGDIDPLDTAESGLLSDHSDVRIRGLQILIAEIRRKKKKTLDDESRNLLLRALNDDHETVRTEALKATLNLKVDGGDAATLSFLLLSVHAGVRREVLTEVMANEKESWSWDLLLKLFDDPDSKIREDAFDHAMKLTKSRDVEPMNVALKSKYADVRRSATTKLIRLKTNASQESLLTAINDSDAKVRELAIDAIIKSQSVDALHEAMESEHSEVRLLAASARAMAGDEAARKTLLDLITADEPEKDSDRTEWKKNLIGALQGIAILGDTSTFESVSKLVDHTDSDIQNAAADAMVWVASENDQPRLRECLQHESKEVVSRAAYALAMFRDSIAAPILLSKEGRKRLSSQDQLISQVVFEELGENGVAETLDSEEPVWRTAALVVMLVRDYFGGLSEPKRCIAAIAAKPPRIRLAAAKSIQCAQSAESFLDNLVEWMNDRGDEKPWTIEADDVLLLAKLIVFADARVKARTVALLKHLGDEKQNGWDLGMANLKQRYADSVADQNSASKTDKASSETRDDLVFGTYVGLVREQGGSHLKKYQPSFGGTIVSVRQEAARRLFELAQAQPDFKTAAIPVLIQTLGDPHTGVRTLAYELLGKLDLETEQLAAAAIECGHDDLAKQGLKLLTSGENKTTSRKILQQVVTSRSDNLSIEAAEMLSEDIGKIKTAGIAVESPNRYLRMQAVSWLSDEYDEDSSAKKELRSLVDARYEDVRKAATLSLANKKDEKAFDALCDILNARTRRFGQKTLDAIVQHGDSRFPKILVDRIKNDPEKTVPISDTFSAIGKFRSAVVAEELLEMMGESKWESALGALMTISGYDQSIQDPWDDRVDKSWLEKQHPRDDAIFARILERMAELGMSQHLQLQHDKARWSQSNAVDPIISQLISYPEERSSSSLCSCSRLATEASPGRSRPSYPGVGTSRSRYQVSGSRRTCQKPE